MKKLITSLVLGFLSTTLFAQNLTFPQWTDTIQGITTDWEITSHEMPVINTSGMNLSLKVKKNEVVTINTTAYYFCWGTTCQSSNDSISTETVVMLNGDTNTTFISYARIASNSANAGVSTIEYCFYETTGAIADFCIKQYFDVSYVSSIIETKSKNNFKIISRKGSISILLKEATQETKINIYDLNGKLVKSKSTNGTETINIPTTGLPTGGYLITVQSKNKFIGSKNIVLVQ